VTSFLGILSALLGVVGVIQWIIGYITGNTLRAKAQASYNQWYRVAELAEQIRQEPTRAVELAASIYATADSSRTEIVAYSREQLSFVPNFERSSQPAPYLSSQRSLWSKIKLGFSPK
jgi:hypothetical protein